MFHAADEHHVSKYLLGFLPMVRVKTRTIDIHRSSAQVDDKIAPLGAKDRKFSTTASFDRNTYGDSDNTFEIVSQKGFTERSPDVSTWYGVSSMITRVLLN